MKKILVNGQWQGGADISTLHGAKEITDFYLNNVTCEIAEVASDENALTVKNNIVGYDILEMQMEKVFNGLELEQPDKLFTIGGGCDADFPSLAYMNKRYGNNLKILYLDAHGDINSPDESESKLFYGMPLRCLIKESGNVAFPFVNCGIKPEQIVHIGARELDDTEKQFFSKNNICRITVEDSEKNDFEKNISVKNENVYIHLDLDVLEPSEFPYVPLPVSGGISFKVLKKILKLVKKNNNIVGVGIFEYKPCGERNELLEYLIQYGIDF